MVLKEVSCVIYFCDFSTSLLQSSMSHDPSETILIRSFAAQGTFLIIIKFENT